MNKDLKEKFAFTLGATHVGISHNIGGTFHRFVESFTHVGISHNIGGTLHKFVESFTHVGIFHNTRRVGFTLAEILITLGIIGIVSAMTIPTLVKEYKTKQTIAKLKQTYSILSQAITRAQVDNGDISTWGLRNFVGQDYSYASVETITTNFFTTYLQPYVKVGRDYGYQGWDEMIANYDCCYSPKNNSRHSLNAGYYFSLSNGTIIGVIPGTNCLEYNEDGSCARTVYSNIDFKVGINGLNEKGTLGKNVFQMYINSNKNILEFYHYSSTTSRTGFLSSCKSNYITCGKLIQYDNWEIKDDYPWK